MRQKRPSQVLPLEPAKEGNSFLKLRVEETKPRTAKSHTAVNPRVAGKEAGS